MPRGRLGRSLLRSLSHGDRTPLTNTSAELVADVPTLHLQYQNAHEAQATLLSLHDNKFVSSLTLLGPHANGEPRRDCGGGDGVAEAAAALLRNNRSIRSLRVVGWNITCQGAAALAAALEELNGGGVLTRLGLAHNRIGADGARKLRSCLRRNYSLVELGLESNPVATSQSSRSAGRMHLKAIHARLEFNRSRSGASRRALGIHRSEVAQLLIRRFGIAAEPLGKVLELAYPVGTVEPLGEWWVWRAEASWGDEDDKSQSAVYKEWSPSESEVQGSDIGFMSWEAYCRKIFQRRNGYALGL